MVYFDVVNYKFATLWSA